LRTECSAPSARSAGFLTLGRSQVSVPCWLLGGHVISWEYDDGGKSCHQRGFCEREDCAKVTARTAPHDFDPWNGQGEGRCETKRTCLRCGFVQYAIEHSYVWRYRQQQSCDQRRECARCGDLDGSQVRTEHIWRGWDFSRDGKSLQDVCTHCGKLLTRPAEMSNP